MTVWTGPGCSEATGYRPVGKTATGMVAWERIDEVSVVDKGAAPGAEVLITKRAGSAPSKEADMAPSISEAIAKAVAPDPDDTEKERMRKAVVQKALATGATTVEKVAAELALDGLATAIRKRRPELSFEAAYVVAMEDNPDLARVALD